MIDVVAVVFVAPTGLTRVCADCGVVSGGDCDIFVDDKYGLESGRIEQGGLGDEGISFEVDAHIALVL